MTNEDFIEVVENRLNRYTAYYNAFSQKDINKVKMKISVPLPLNQQDLPEKHLVFTDGIMQFDIDGRYVDHKRILEEGLHAMAAFCEKQIELSKIHLEFLKNQFEKI